MNIINPNKINYTFMEWMHIMKFNGSHHVISDGTDNRRFYTVNGSTHHNDNKNEWLITIENKYYDWLKISYLQYEYLLTKVWNFQLN